MDKHNHEHTETEKAIHRLSRAIGHLESVKKMVADGRDCTEVPVQLAAVKSAVSNVGKLILQGHIRHCVVDAAESGDTQALQDLSAAIDQFVK